VTAISRFLARKTHDYENPSSLGSRLRARRARPLVELIRDASRGNGGGDGSRVRVLDVGGTRAYWNALPDELFRDHRLEVTIANLADEAGAPEEGFRYLQADGCDLSMFADNSFHVAHSNSVIEHVGDWKRMRRFASEIARVARSYFVQTPNFWFPVEPHCMTPFFHWLPRSTRRWMVMRSALGQWPRATSTDEALGILESARLLDREMMTALFPGARILTERLLLMPKSLIAVKGRAGDAPGSTTVDGKP
jgi:hypothetical protein